MSRIGIIPGIQVFDPEGRLLRKWGNDGDEDGQFSQPVGIAVDGEGNVYVVDAGNHRIQVFDQEGQFLRKWGSNGYADGEFFWPDGIAVDGEGRVYVSELFNHRIQVFRPAG